MQMQTKYAKMTNPITLNGKVLKFDQCADHVGMVRCVTGNNVPIFARFKAHEKALGAVLHAGMARGHRGNPAASLKVEQIYGVPVLLSGLAPLVLNKSEENQIDQHHKAIVMNLQRLLPCTLGGGQKNANVKFELAY